MKPPEESLIDGYDYFNLIALYNRLLLPLPQRKHKNNRKSKSLEAKQIDCNKRFATKRKSEDLTNSCNTKKLKTNSYDRKTTLDGNGEPEINCTDSHPNQNKRQRISWP